MPFIPGKLKPRIKPRIGPKLVENSSGSSTELSKSGNGTGDKVKSDTPVHHGASSSGFSEIEAASPAAIKSSDETSTSPAATKSFDEASARPAATKSFDEASASPAATESSLVTSVCQATSGVEGAPSHTHGSPMAREGITTPVSTPRTVDHEVTSSKPWRPPAASLESGIGIAVDITRETKTEERVSYSDKKAPSDDLPEQASLEPWTVNQGSTCVKNYGTDSDKNKLEEQVDAVPEPGVTPPTAARESKESSQPLPVKLGPKVGNQLGLKFHRPNLKAKSRPNVALARAAPSTNSGDPTKKVPQLIPCNDAAGSCNFSEKGVGEGETVGESPPPRNDVADTITVVPPGSPSVSIGLPNEVQSSQPQLLDDALASNFEQANTVGEAAIQPDSRGVDLPLDSNKILRNPLKMRKVPKLMPKKNQAEVGRVATPPPEPPLEKPAVLTQDNSLPDDASKRDLESTCFADIENISQETVPVVDTTLAKSSPSVASPLAAVNSNAKSLSAKHGNSASLEVQQEQDEPPVKSLQSKNSSKSKTSKPEAEDVKTLYAISAVDYLRRHDHALGDSILRRLIIGDKNLKNRQLKPSMCSSCNPQTLRKCLASLWSFDKNELLVIVKKSAERQKTPLSYANFPGKPLFKPSLGRQRAPTLTASTYGKMSLEVKERLVNKYGPNSKPELSKLRMLDLIFYNPSENPLNKPSKDGHDKSQNRMKSESSASEEKPSNQRTPAGSDSDSDDPDDPIEKKSEEIEGGDQATSSVPVPQVRIGDEGQIILAPESLVVKKPESDVLKAPVLQESSFADSNRKKVNPHRTAWTFEETLEFYKALHGIGTDFTSMNELFPNRTRQNLKTKFKREEKKNPALIDKVLMTQGQNLDFADVEKDLTADKTLRRLCMENSVAASEKSLVKRVNLNKYLNPEMAGEDGEEAADEVPLPSSVPIKKRPHPKNTCEDSDDKTKSRKKSPKAKKREGDGNEDSPSDEGLKAAKDATVQDDESGPVFKIPTSRPLRKKSTGRGVTTNMPKVVLSADGGSHKASTSPDSRDSECQMDSEGIFKKPLHIPAVLKRKVLKRRLPKKRKAPKLKEEDSGPHIHKISFEDDPVDDTEDEESPVKSSDESFTIKTDVDCGSYNVTRSVTVNFSEPDVPVDINETIEHKECDCATEEDQVVEVVTIDVNEISSFLERTGAIVVGKVDSQSDVRDPLTCDPLVSS